MRKTFVLLAIVLLMGCAGPGATPTAPAPDSPAPASPALTPEATPETTPAATLGATPAAPTPETTPAATPETTAAATPDEGTFSNPVLDANFADPHVIEVDGTYYAYATVGHGHNVQYSTSTDMVSWERPREALPRLPLWSPGHTWAPEVAETSAGFVMYYTLRASGLRRPDGQGSQCISIAVAADPAGPFVDENEEPVICQPELGGSIDAHHFIDQEGTHWLVWKNDGNCCSMATRMWMQEVSEDGLELVGEPIDMGVRNDQRWEGALIEAPTVLYHEGNYYLFYSANAYYDDTYAVGYAVSESVTGPYEKPQNEPILSSERPAAGPGGQAIITDAAGELWVYYHAWDYAAMGEQAGGRRAMWLDRLSFEDGRPVIHGPTADPQPVPQAEP
jgi:beta-xylosidase